MAEISFDSVMRDHNNWPEEIDFDGMEESYHKIKPIMNKMFFEEYPDHPKMFVMIFSKPDLIEAILKAMVDSGITQLNRIWFRECSLEDEQKMMEKGLLPPIMALKGILAMGLMRNANDFFVNLFYNE